jgi:NAD(P)-dependent dehydrogenase (short-subunit alcohol dehydrogenase family)
MTFCGYWKTALALMQYYAGSAYAGNKIAVISGATGGIGSAVAKALSGTGYRLVLSGRFVPKLNALASSIQTPSVIVVGDLQGASIPETLLSKAVESFGRCDICLNNGGLLFLLRQAPHVRISGNYAFSVYAKPCSPLIHSGSYLVAGTDSRLLLA